MGWWAAGRLVTTVGVLCACATASQAILSLPGDADCDGFVTSQDLVHLQEELVDGDGIAVGAAGGGTVLSCSGADANGDLSVTIADTTALIQLLFGRGSPTTSSGPVVTYIGVAGADGTVAEPLSGGVVPIFRRAGLFGFYLVIEVARGSANVPVLVNTSPLADPSFCPDLQVSFSQALGKGSVEVCDENGVPSVFPPHFDDPALCPLFNDVSCRFQAITNPAAACTTNRFGSHTFVDSRTRLQLCLPVAQAEAFADGSTVVTARVLDSEGAAGEPKQAIVHVGTGPPPTAIPTPTASSTRGPAPTRTITPRRSPIATAPRGTPTATVAAAEPTATELPTVIVPTRSTTSTSGPTAPTATPSVTARPRTPTRTATLPTATATARGTRRPTATATRVPSATATRAGVRTRTPTGTASATASTLPTRTSTRTRTALPSATPSPTRRPLLTPTSRNTTTPTREPTLRESRTPARSPTNTVTATITRTPRPSATPTTTRTPSITPIPSLTRTPTSTPSVTRTRSPSRTRTSTRTPGPTARPGPDITFFGVGTPDFRVIQPTKFRDGIPIYERRLGYNLSLIVEGKAGPSRQPVGSSADPFDLSGRPDIQVIVDVPLGANPTTEVCDVPPKPRIGGVPASPSFADTPAISNAISDLGCRFVDGNGNPRARTSSSDACTPFDGVFHFVVQGSSTQFCASVFEYFGFRVGKTTVSARLRDRAGNVSEVKRLIIDVIP